MVQLFLDGGGFMWPILIVFIFGLAFVIERIYHLLKGMTTDLSFAESISDVEFDAKPERSSKYFAANNYSSIKQIEEKTSAVT